MHGTKGYLNQLINQINNNMVFNAKLKKENFISEDIYSFCLKNSNNYKFDHIQSDQFLQPFFNLNLNQQDQTILNAYFNENYSQ